MATKDTERFLKDLMKFVGEHVRSNLNNFYTVAYQGYMEINNAYY